RKFGRDDVVKIESLLPLTGGDGKYTRDYEYICGKGDLNECNGIEAPLTITTSKGEETFDFYYVVSSEFPKIPRCLLGTVSEDFTNSAPTLMGIDMDGDGFIAAFDCDDTNGDVNPLAAEVEGNDVDENCDNSLTSVVELVAYGISIGPNPNQGLFRVITPDYRTYDLVLYNLSGQVVRRVAGSGELVVRDLVSGTYLVSIRNNGHLLGSEKIIVL
ncbi:MAG: T9SS type A sorting domain-containing protein, partial [Bacteroidota bacterium]